MKKIFVITMSLVFLTTLLLVGCEVAESLDDGNELSGCSVESEDNAERTTSNISNPNTWTELDTELRESINRAYMEQVNAAEIDGQFTELLGIYEQGVVFYNILGSHARILWEAQLSGHIFGFYNSKELTVYEFSSSNIMTFREAYNGGLLSDEETGVLAERWRNSRFSAHDAD